MSSTRNPDSIEPGKEIGVRKAGDEPLTTKGHAPGVKATAADFAPEFHAKVLPAGTAPADKTYLPNTENEIPGQAGNPDAGAAGEGTYTKALDGLPGATSADVHMGLGKPVQGQTAGDVGHKSGGGIHGSAAAGIAQADQRTDPSQRALDRNDAAGANKAGKMDATPAQELEPQTAEDVASERA